MHNIQHVTPSINPCVTGCYYTQTVSPFHPIHVGQV